MSDTQGHAGSGAKFAHPSATIIDWEAYAKSLESEVTRLRAELGEAKGRARIAELDADRLASEGWHERACGGDILEQGPSDCKPPCAWGWAIEQHEKAVAARPAPPAEREKGEEK